MVDPFPSRPMRRTLALLLVITAPVGAQMVYKQPPAAIAKILDTPPTPAASFSPDRTKMLMTERNGLPPISDVGAPYLRLAGTRVNPRTNGSWREVFAHGLVVRPINAATETRIQTPPGAKISHVMWSDDSKKIAFTITEHRRRETLGRRRRDRRRAQAHRCRSQRDPKSLLLDGRKRTHLPDRSRRSRRRARGGGNPCRTDRPGSRRAQGPRADVRGPSRQPVRRKAFRLLLRLAARDHLAQRHGHENRREGNPLRAHHHRPTANTSSSRRCTSRTRIRFPKDVFPALTEVWDRTGKVVRKSAGHAASGNPRRADRTRSKQVRATSAGVPDAPASLVWS